MRSWMPGVHEVRGADLDRPAARDQELEGVARREEMPPTPITGIFTARAACQAMRTATGRMAGPERPAGAEGELRAARLDVDGEARAAC